MSSCDCAGMASGMGRALVSALPTAWNRPVPIQAVGGACSGLAGVLLAPADCRLPLSDRLRRSHGQQNP